MNKSNNNIIIIKDSNYNDTAYRKGSIVKDELTKKEREEYELMISLSNT